MKKKLPCILASLIVLGVLHPAVIYAQDRNFYTWSSENHQVYSDESKSCAVEISQKMEASLKLFNELFHFDLSDVPSKFRVRIFSEKENFDIYLQTIIAETRTDFVFISYKDLARSEMVGFQREEIELNASLMHYGFIQYLNAMIPHAPLWLEEGMAAYLEYSKYDPFTESFTWQPNLIWLESLKTILKGEKTAGPLPISELIVMDKTSAQEKIDVFYPTSWGLVHFLMSSSDSRYNRIIWDSISALDENLSLTENSLRVKQKAFSWVKDDRLQKDFQAFILSLKSFNELVKEGIEFYGNDQIAEAENSFKKTFELRTDNYIPYYYMGLIKYERKDYQEAHKYYSQALELGIEPGLINYALGVNAFADKRYTLAENYLKQAKAIDTETYGDKADSLLKRIEFLK